MKPEGGVGADTEACSAQEMVTGQDKERRGVDGGNRLHYHQRMEVRTPWNRAKELTHEKGQSIRRKGLLIVCGGALGGFNNIPD